MKILHWLLVLPMLNLNAAELDAAAPAVKAVNDFAAAHHRLLPAGNALVSPWSVQTNLAMVYAGADGKTHEAMRTALSFGSDEPALHLGFQSLQQALRMKPAAGVPMDLRTVNQLFVARSLALQQRWLEITRSSYAAEATPADFAHDAQGETARINQWISQQTNAKIPEIVPAGALDPLTLMVLVNAVYFDMPWDEQFTKTLTTDQPFHIDAAHAKTVPLMFKQHALRYAQEPGFQIAALPYAGGTFQFVVILPDAMDGLAALEQQLTGELLSECAKLAPAEVRLSLPRIVMASPVTSLKQTLSALGAGEMFDRQKADFSRMVVAAAKLSVHVSNLFHRTFIELDEDGTKAAAATSTIIRAKNGVPRERPHKVVKADHPFLFMIQHVPSGACLFLGRLSDPAPGSPSISGPPSQRVRPASKK
ncbi:MAG: serpin family protein [Prosthecobacter sp.]|uniref:serpin family protein n=1 Tax=Prosthecobacter sp. TaxID=1965333 RepID=UPI0038FFD76B